MLRVYLKPLSPWYDNPPYHTYYHFTLYTHTYIHTYQIWLVSIKERCFGGRPGLPKLQIEWFNGLESWIQTRGGVIWLGDYPSCKLSGSTVWNPESKHVEGWFDLGTTQAANRVVRRFGILNPNKFEGWFDLGTTQAANWVVQRFGILNPNTLRGDLTWGLPKLQIEWFNSLESWIQTRWGVIWLGDYPSFKSSGSTLRQIAI